MHFGFWFDVSVASNKDSFVSVVRATGPWNAAKTSQVNKPQGRRNIAIEWFWMIALCHAAWETQIVFRCTNVRWRIIKKNWSSGKKILFACILLAKCVLHTPHSLLIFLFLCSMEKKRIKMWAKTVWISAETASTVGEDKKGRGRKWQKKSPKRKVGNLWRNFCFRMNRIVKRYHLLINFRETQ